MNRQFTEPGSSRVFTSILGAVLVIFITLTALGGMPPAEKIPGFIVGIFILIAVTVGIGLVGWHLLVRPLPDGLQVTPQSLLTARARNIIALVLTLGTVSIAIAGVWDEIWHVKYGIPFGEDFFWRPHLLLYFGLSSLALVGMWSWWTIQTRGKGTLQQRFRANPLLGVSFLGGLYTVYAVGADPLWHRFYGADLAPWSLPHILILMLIFIMSVLAISYHKTFMAAREWRFKLQATWRDVLLVLVLAGALLDFTLILTIQWYSAASSGGERQLAQVLSYPDWLLAVFITFLATLFGTTALHATRQFGSATFVGLLAIGMRFVLDNGLDGVRDGTIPLWLVLPLMLAMDIWYAVSVRRAQQPPAFWTTAVVAALAFGIICFPLAAGIFPFMELTVADAPAMVIASLVTALGGIWLGQIVGESSRYGKAEAATTETKAPAPQWVNGLLYVAFAVFVVFFAATATPPV